MVVAIEQKSSRNNMSESLAGSLASVSYYRNLSALMDLYEWKNDVPRAEISRLLIDVYRKGNEKRTQTQSLYSWRLSNKLRVNIPETQKRQVRIKVLDPVVVRPCIRWFNAEWAKDKPLDYDSFTLLFSSDDFPVPPYDEDRDKFSWSMKSEQKFLNWLDRELDGLSDGDGVEDELGDDEDYDDTEDEEPQHQQQRHEIVKLVRSPRPPKPYINKMEDDEEDEPDNLSPVEFIDSITDVNVLQQITIAGFNRLLSMVENVSKEFVLPEENRNLWNELILKEQIRQKRFTPEELAQYLEIDLNDLPDFRAGILPGKDGNLIFQRISEKIADPNEEYGNAGYFLNLWTAGGSGKSINAGGKV